jgi:dipeptidase
LLASQAAQRVPDTHAAVVANSFTIRNMSLDGDHNDTFAASPDLLVVATDVLRCPRADAAAKWLDFTGCFSGPERKYNSGRRMWVAYGLLAPNTFHASPVYEDYVVRAPAGDAIPPPRLAPASSAVRNAVCPSPAARRVRTGSRGYRACSC